LQVSICKWLQISNTLSLLTNGHDLACSDSPFFLYQPLSPCVETGLYSTFFPSLLQVMKGTREQVENAQHDLMMHTYEQAPKCTKRDQDGVSYTV